MILNVTTMQAPFELYYVELFKRYWQVRSGIRRCIKMCDADSEYLETLVKLDRLLSAVVADKSIKIMVKKLQHY